MSLNIYTNGIPSIQNDYNVTISLYAVDKSVTIRSESMQLTTNVLYTAVKILEPWLAIGKLRLTLVKVPSYYFPNGGVTSSLITPQQNSFIYPLIGQIRSNILRLPSTLNLPTSTISVNRCVQQTTD